MSPFPTIRRALWAPGAFVLVAAATIGAVLGASLGLRSWPPYLGFMLGALLAIGWLERLWARHRQPPPSPRVRSKLKVIRGGKSYDLEKDDSTDGQRYLM
jgi:hypothetical protein